MLNYGIEEIAVYGVKNPRLILKGWIELNKYKLVLEIDNEIIYEHNYYKVNWNNRSAFSINMPIKKNKGLNLVAIKDGKRYVLKQINTNFIKRLWKRIFPKFRKLSFSRFKRLFYYEPLNIKQYNKWLQKNEVVESIKKHKYNPLISIVMPVYNVKKEYLVDCLNSILNQTYQNFEICIADDYSTNKETLATLKKYAKKDSRIKIIYRDKNGHISEATNTALTLAKGEFVALMDNDDMLPKHSLNEIVYVLNNNKDLDFIYTDEDKINLKGERCDPHFKSDFQIDSFYGGNYMCHFSVIRRSIIKKIHGFRKTYEGAQDFDLFLRVSNETNKIYHLPKILYHWRMIPGSTALASESKNYAGEAGKRALEDYFKKKNINVNIDIIINTQYFVEYLLDNHPKVSIIIRSKKEEALGKCLESIYRNTFYQNFEIIIVIDEQQNFEKTFNKYKKHNIKILKTNKCISISESYNDASKKATGQYIVFLDEYSKIKTFNWLDLMVGYASQKEIGCVGVKILNENQLIKEGGLILNKDKIYLNTFVGKEWFDYGVHGRLLVPHNYKAVEPTCMMIEKKKFIEANYFDKNLEFRFSNIDLCLKVKQKYRNIFVPQVELINYRNDKKRIKFYKRIKLKYDKSLIKNKWFNELQKDECYNQNMDKENLFKLNKKSDGTKS